VIVALNLISKWTVVPIANTSQKSITVLKFAFDYSRRKFSVISQRLMLNIHKFSAV
jgi:hypothetical protein